ncbi:uncharacterized protein KZ484_020223 [Pholidichthys leucotaenia]
MLTGRWQTEKMKESEMLVVVMSLLCWTQAQGACNTPKVILHGNEMMVPVGGAFTVNCEFTCLTVKHVAQLWRDHPQDKASLLNATAIKPNVTLVLNISSATEGDGGHYFCMTHPPHAISPRIQIRVDNLTRYNSTLTTPSITHSEHTQQPSSTAGLLGQMWCWMLLGKTAILLLIVASLTVKYKRG